MEGASVLVSDFGEGICYNILELLTARKAVPYVFVKDFEKIQEVFDAFPAAIPVVLDIHHNMEVSINILRALPTMSCIFNLDGEILENMYRQTFDHFHKTISITADEYDDIKICNEIRDATIDGYTLIINFLSLSLCKPMNSNSSSVEKTLLTKADPTTIATSSTDVNSSRNLKFIFEKLFFRHPAVLAEHKLALKGKGKKISDKVSTSQGRRTGTPIRELLRKMFTKMNPCSTISIVNLLPSMSRGAPVKSPEEISKYIKTQESQEIKSKFQLIQDSALRNWAIFCEESLQGSLRKFEEKFTTMCHEIRMRGEEGRKMLLDKVNKDIERTKQWDHVLGAKTIDRLRTSRDIEIELKVQHFCKRKIAEARQKINDEIEEKRDLAKAKFYGEILEEQIKELLPIKEKYEKRRDLLMLPYTGELKLLHS